MNRKLEKLVIARDELIKTNDKIYELLCPTNEEIADTIEETIDNVSIIIAEIIDEMIKLK